MEQPDNVASNNSADNTELPKNNSSTSSHSKNLVYIVLSFVIVIVIVLSVLFFINFKKSTQQNRAASWSEGPMVMGEEAIAIDFDPDTFNRRSAGLFVTVYIELPPGFDVKNIDISTIRLNGTVAAQISPSLIGDHDGDGRPDLMVKFKRKEVSDLFADQPVPQHYEVQVAGTVDDFIFSGTTFVRVIDE